MKVDPNKCPLSFAVKEFNSGFVPTFSIQTEPPNSLQAKL